MASVTQQQMQKVREQQAGNKPAPFARHGRSVLNQCSGPAEICFAHTLYSAQLRALLFVLSLGNPLWVQTCGGLYALQSSSENSSVSF